MEVAAVTLQQAGSQTNLAMSLLKKNTQADQSLVNVIQQSVQSNGRRGQNLDVTV